MEKFSPCVRNGVWTLAAFLTVAGCQQFGLPSTSSPIKGDFDVSSVKIKPKQAADVQVALAHTMELQGEKERALALYEEAVQKDPGRADAWLRLAVLHDQQGGFTESAAMYQKALKGQPGSPEIYCDMGYSLYLQQRWAEAEMNLRQALALRPNHARAHNNLGLVLARTGQTEEALNEFHLAGCSDADTHVNLAFALTLEHHWPEACQHYQQALQMDSSSAPAKKGLRELQRLIARMNAPAPSPSEVSSSPIAQTQGTTSPTPPSIPTGNGSASTEISSVPAAAASFAAPLSRSP
ncbi:MAG TPA: tetratricopeptide repeat protein [Gemmataceae bacterium]|jgi:Tfp pilus assembly protein PilF